MKSFFRKKSMKLFFRKTCLFLTTFILGAFNCLNISAQALAGIEEATAQITTLAPAVSKLIMAIGAIVGLIGGVRCYIKWNTGDQDVMKSVMGWGGACIFIVLVGMVVGGFFGIPLG